MKQTTKERRAALTEAILEAVGKTWRSQEGRGELSDPDHRLGVLRGGCEHFLAHGFDGGGALSLGLAFLTLARELFIVHGLDVWVRPGEEESILIGEQERKEKPS